MNVVRAGGLGRDGDLRRSAGRSRTMPPVALAIDIQGGSGRKEKGNGKKCDRKQASSSRDTFSSSSVKNFKYQYTHIYLFLFKNIIQEIVT